MGRSNEGIRAPSRAGRLWLGAAAAFGLVVLGGFAIFLTQRTVPVPIQIRPGTAMSPATDSVRSAPPAPSAGGQAGIEAGMAPATIAADPAIGPLPRQEAAPVSLRVPVQARDPERSTRPASDTRASRSSARRDAPDTGARARASAGGRTTDDRSNRGAQPEGGIDRPAAPAGAGVAKTLAAGPAGAAVAAAPQRLEPLVQAECADSQFLGKLICRERVRLRFCQGRWNSHLDCMVEERTPTY